MSKVAETRPPAPGTREREAWNIFIDEEVENGGDPTFTQVFSREQRQSWEQYRDNYLKEHRRPESVVGEEDQPKAVLTEMSTSKMKEIEDDEAKLYRQLASSPEDFDGNRTKFANWWANMQMYMMGFNKINSVGRIIGVLSRCTKGEVAAWAEVKKQQVLAGALKDWEAFKTQIEDRFNDPTRIQKAQHDIHGYVQGKEPVQTYIDHFENLKELSKISDADALYLFRRGLKPEVLSRIYAADVEGPTTYKELIDKARKIGLNLDIIRGFKNAAVGASTSVKPSYPSKDVKTGTGTTYGGSGKPMEIDRTGPRCYNCNGFGHMARECKKPKREKGACFECGKQGHVVKDCPQKKKKGGSKGKIKKVEEEPKEEPTEIEDEIEDEEVEEEEDFMEGDE